ncbi:MAG: hypothetical protein DRJ08_04360 [Acidobacteria bacterium]|nr:MAG: hypothetical protein DRJ14_05935 [Acidobacteriota bacterium]RLE22255.1 MAG: hypothetical protein DRJ08_04360 [Acidobacteriota bacterium]
MKIAVDLHSHSGYSGGVGKIRLSDIAETMRLKGINVFGTGDCLHPAWNAKLKEKLKETDNGIYRLSGFPGAGFILQNEMVLTAALFPSSKTRKSVHMVFLYPNFHATEIVSQLLEKYGVKNTIGRPFVKLESPSAVSEFLQNIMEAAPGTLAFPAHAMTPDGIYGSHNPVTYLEEFFGDYAKQIRLIETGLSADPEMLDRIPECRTLNFISNSDCHSAALNRIGREFTVLNVDTPDYSGIRKALTETGITATFEFNPREGKFFATGHRKGKEGHSQKSFRLEKGEIPSRCPVCGKALTIGVADRVNQLAESQKKQIALKSPHRNFYHLIPLVEVIAAGLGQKSVSGKKVLSLYRICVQECGNEVSLWQMKSPELAERLWKIPESVLAAILSVHEGKFTFDPPGYDGEYGKLKILQN